MSEQARIQVLLVDDHDMVRWGLAAFIATFDDMELAGEASNGVEAVRRYEALLPDVVLMDLKMPEMDGVAAIAAIHARFPSARIIALTSFREEGLVQQALQAGALSYLLKNATAAELAAAIRAAAAGRPTLAPEAALDLIRATTRPESPGHDLTPREREVLALMVQGLNNNGIADRLVVSLSTAKTHVSSILAKLGATSRTEAVALAVQHKLVP
jgi:NarL family two-component system response regulator LiaR